MRRSRSLSTESASPSAFLRFTDSSLSASRDSWSELSSTSQSCHSLPLAGIGILAHLRVERDVAAEPAVHLDHVLLGDAEALRDQLDLIGMHVAFLQRRDAVLRLAQVEEQLLLIGSGAHLHQRPR